jgi:hypothetical protein
MFILTLILLHSIPVIEAGSLVCADGSVSPSCSACNKGCCSRHGGCGYVRSSSVQHRSVPSYKAPVYKAPPAPPAASVPAPAPEPSAKPVAASVPQPPPPVGDTCCCSFCGYTLLLFVVLVWAWSARRAAVNRRKEVNDDRKR